MLTIRVLLLIGLAFGSTAQASRIEDLLNQNPATACQNAMRKNIPTCDVRKEDPACKANWSRYQQRTDECKQLIAQAKECNDRYRHLGKEGKSREEADMVRQCQKPIIDRIKALDH